MNSSSRRRKKEKLGRRYQGREKCQKKSKAGLENCCLFFKCFCGITNGRKLLSLSSGEGQFGCINGMRFLSNCNVVAIHMSLVYFYVLRNFEELKPMIESWIIPVAANHIVTVDTFFVISGFLNAYLFSQRIREIEWKSIVALLLYQRDLSVVMQVLTKRIIRTWSSYSDHANVHLAKRATKSIKRLIGASTRNVHLIERAAKRIMRLIGCFNMECASG
ncbi:nose resistant to fluoxetine protein 6 [Caerostris extrusa]|uniref:Nose resistant to fluoxetine protein 6 n=1 Tax=Caerostris extrusa TaxID=172846 RepID=A0AAV4WUI4_CAEEX|nr:nose resistant to fluoxetine protein 6 [Caerostris extrusa]